MILRHNFFRPYPFLMKTRWRFVFEDLTFTAMCCTASSSFLEQARIAAAMMEPIKMMLGMNIENMLLV